MLQSGPEWQAEAHEKVAASVGWAQLQQHFQAKRQQAATTCIKSAGKQQKETDQKRCLTT